MRTLKTQTPLVLLSFVLAATILYPNDSSKLLIERQIIPSILATQADTVVTDIMGNDYSAGYIFSPRVDGRITQLGISLPDSGIFQVSIWDVDSKTLITRTIIHQNNDQWVYKDIHPVTVEKDKKYIACMMLPLGTRYYSAPNLKLPLEANNIQVMNGVAAFGDAYPADQIITDALFGFIDVTFENIP